MATKKEPKPKFVRLDSEGSADAFLLDEFASADEGGTAAGREAGRKRYSELVAAAQVGLEMAELFTMLRSPNLEHALELFANFKGRKTGSEGELETEAFEEGNWSAAQVFGLASRVESAPHEVPVLQPLALALPGIIDELRAIEKLGRLSRLKVTLDGLIASLPAAQRQIAFRTLSSPLNMACACVLLVAESRSFKKYPSPRQIAAIFSLVGDPRLGSFVLSPDPSDEQERLSKLESSRKTMLDKVIKEVLPTLRNLVGSTAPPISTKRKGREGTQPKNPTLT